MLEVMNVHTYYGDSHILQGLYLKVDEGECVALLGPNGMGKTTTLRTIMGLTHAKSGSVRFKGEEVTRWPPYKIARLGIGYVPEERCIFEGLTVLENLRIPFVNLGRNRIKNWQETLENIFTLFPKLRTRLKQVALSLSGGEQQMLAIARALIMGRKIVLLDEPTEGLAPLVAQDLVDSLLKVKEQGLTILLVEQNIQTAKQISDRCYIIEKGRIRFEERMDILCQDPALMLKYLGLS